MHKFQPLTNVRLTCANSQQQAENIVNFVNSHADELGVTVHIENNCVVYADSIKLTSIDYILGVIAGHLLTK